MLLAGNDSDLRKLSGITGRWREFTSRKKCQALMRKASTGYNTALKTIESRWRLSGGSAGTK